MKKILAKLKSTGLKTATFIGNLLPSIIIGMMLTLMIFTFGNLQSLNIGYGKFLDILIFITLFIVVFLASFYLSKLILYILRKLPFKTRHFAFLGVIYGFISVIDANSTIINYVLLIGSVFALLFYFITKQGIHKYIKYTLFLGTVTLFVFLIFQLRSDGKDNYTKYKEGFYTNLTLKNIETPAKEGTYKYQQLTYASKKDRHRNEFAENATLKSDSVDLSPFLKLKGFNNTVRKTFWGHDLKEAPLNGRVWYPETNDKSPIVLIVHGNHSMHDFSDIGYDYLGELLASKGNIVVSVDENFLNGASMFHDFRQNENLSRGIILLEHLRQWRKWNSDEAHIFFNKVDLNNIVLVGHSRGGEAVGIAAEMNKLNKYHKDGNVDLDYNFNIKGIVQIAPTDFHDLVKGQDLVIKDMNYLLIHSLFDSDVSTPVGNRIYNRLQISDSTNYFKSVISSYRSNHGQFNTSWGSYDSGFPRNLTLNVKPLLPEEQQREIAKVYISAFVETVTEKSNTYKNLFKDFRYGLDWLPKDYYTSQYEDANIENIVDYEDDMDILNSERATLSGENLVTWKENVQTMRNSGKSPYDNRVVTLKWDKKDTVNTKGTAKYNINWKSKNDTLSNTSLSFYMANIGKTKADSLDFTIQLRYKDSTSKEISIKDIGHINPHLELNLYKWEFLNDFDRFSSKKEYLLQRYVIDSKFSGNANDLTGMSFIFDKAEKGTIILDKISLIND